MTEIHFSNTRKDGITVPPKSSDAISKMADSVRDILDLKNESYFPIMKVYEALPFIFEGSEFEVKYMHEMHDDHGRTYPDKKLIWIREDVYLRADEGRPRDRFTLCHELGHLFMHQGVALARVNPTTHSKIYTNSEWQADKFASYLLMPKNLLREHLSINEAIEKFGVSYEAVNARKNELKKH